MNNNTAALAIFEILTGQQRAVEFTTTFEKELV